MEVTRGGGGTREGRCGDGGGSDERWKRHERREVWRRKVEVTRGGGGTKEGRGGEGRWK